MKLLMAVLAAIAVIAIGVEGAVAGGGGGGGGGIESAVTIHLSDDGSKLYGKVRSERRKCRKHRDVALFWDPPGPPPEFFQVDGDFTNRKGRWSIKGPEGEIPPGRYYAEALRKGDCKPARSRTITVD